MEMGQRRTHLAGRGEITMIVKLDTYLPDLPQDRGWAGIEHRTLDVHFQQIEGPYFDQIKEIGKRKCAHLDNTNHATRWIE